MYTNRISAQQRAAFETEVRRAAGYRAAASLAVLGLISAIAIGSGSRSTSVEPLAGNSALGMHTESYDFSAPASLEDEFRREAIAAAPATGKYEEPDLIVNHQVHG